MAKNNKFEIEKIHQRVDEIKNRISRETLSKSRENAFAGVYIAVKETLNLMAFDEQLEAAFCLDEMMIVQMKTGEGKTLSAVFTAVWNALCGQKVHILTFNDYLAQRDFNWMKPVYEYLGISIAVITENSSLEERKAAYQADVLYTTAKQAGFDYLRDFVADSADKIIQSNLDFAIVDEADSIMIDEGRNPLVIAAMADVGEDFELEAVCSKINILDEGCYSIDLENHSAYLTDKGISALENELEIDNLYEDDNAVLLTKINDALKAFFLLEIDKDYMVRGGEIVLIDEFTGRAALNRHYPGFTHSAIELKHGLKPSRRGKVMGTVAMQFFLRRYEKLSGMTGTAYSASDEFDQLYGLPLAEISTHNPMVRIDNEIEIFTHNKAKWVAVISAIKEANAKGQPVLVGTENIAESQFLDDELSKAGIKAQILNAKNDFEEAEIISDAGDFGKVTVTTSMAGRGVDIKLGGKNEINREKVINAGGLLIVGTFLARSERVNLQLNGRAGRQGDVGESRLFVALDDEIFIKYDLKNLVPKRHYPKENQSEKLENSVLLREIRRIQRVSQGEDLDQRIRLMKYAFISEKHRDIIFLSRKSHMLGEQNSSIWKDNQREKYEKAVQKFGESQVVFLQNRILCTVLNDLWSEYIDYTEYLKRGIHLMRVGGKSPSEEFNILVEEYYDELTEMIILEVENALDTLLELENISDFEVKFPQEIWTYLVEENTSELLKKPFILNLAETEIISDGALERDEQSTIFTSQNKDTNNVEKIEKKGFFSKIFNKK